MPTSTNGKAVMLKFESLSALIVHINLLSVALNTSYFEIVPAIFTKIKPNCQTTVPSSSLSSLPSKKDYDKCYAKKYAQNKLKRAVSSVDSDMNFSSKRARIITQKPTKEEYLAAFDAEKHGPLHEQNWAQKNMSSFHKSMKMTTVQCPICYEAWPMRSFPQKTYNYVCSRCSRNKKNSKKFSKDNGMVSSPVPPELTGFTQIEEMLISRTLPVMTVYIKPGVQPGYSGHCINLPQNITELASSLPRYAKDVSVILVKMKGKIIHSKMCMSEGKKLQMH